MHWVYYLLIGAAVIVLLNVLLVIYLAIANRDHESSRSARVDSGDA